MSISVSEQQQHPSPPDHRAAQWRTATALIVAAVIGYAAFHIAVGTAVLDPRNIVWLNDGDPAQYYLTWSFFRRGGWSMPPAANPDFGLEIASTIYFGDIIPLIALVAKVFAPAVGPWQYFGWWLLACFVLQSVFASRIAGLYLQSVAARSLVAVLVTFAPVFVHRLQLHYSLCGQWILLAALFLCLRKPERSQVAAWLALLVMAAMVHSYFQAMVLVLWLADVVRRALAGQAMRHIAAEFVLGVGLTAGALWLAGFRLLDGGGLAQGRFFGQHQAHLTGFIDSAGWSWLIPAIARPAPSQGFAFLGLGGLFLTAAAAVAACRRRPWIARARGYVPLGIAVAGLTLFALSHRITLGNWVLVEIPMPEFVLALGELFRASERMAWPLYYLVLLGAAILVGRRLGPGRAAAVLGLAAVLQIGDSAAGWMPFRERLSISASTWPTSMQNPFWSSAGREYRKLRRIPPQSHAPRWPELAYFALQNGMGTDIVYLARYSFGRMGALHGAGMQAVATGRFAHDTLYILDDVAARRAIGTVDRSRDLLARIDGLDVLAPGWLARHAAPPGAVLLTSDAVVPLFVVGQAMGTGAGMAGVDALRTGWSRAEGWGSWSDGVEADIDLRLDEAPESGLMLRIEGRSLVTAAHPLQRVSARLGGQVVGTWQIGIENNRVTIDIPIDPALLERQPGGIVIARISLQLPDAARPASLGINDDERHLAIGLESLRLMRRPSDGR